MVADDWFAQTLEGDESIVRELYEKIATDSRHEQVTLLKATKVEDRTFGRWAMARVSEDGGPDIRLLSNAKAGKIVEAGADYHISPEQESVLEFMRGSVPPNA